MLTPRLVRRVRPAFVMAGGLLVASAGLFAFTRFDASTGLATFVIASIAFAVGLCPMVILTTDLIIRSAPQEKAGAASGISETSAEFGGALGIALYGSIGVAVYRAAMADVTIDVPPAAADAARDTLGGAIAVAAELPAQVGDALVAAARDAFIRGMQLTAAISAVGTAALAVFVAVALRRERGSGASE
jgi:DHA2 family multidrug resistance protein-like MFS transporter